MKDTLAMSPKEFKKLALSYPSASEFSGALEWAHRQGVMGENTLILAMENEGKIQHPDLKGVQNAPKGLHSHAVGVLGILYEVAPLAKIVLLPNARDPSLPLNIPPAYAHSAIINASFGLHPGEEDISFAKDLGRHLAQITGKTNLLVLASGNMGQDLEKSSENHVLDAFFSANPNLKNRLIIAGGLTPSTSPSKTSSKPGANRAFQERFLCALGVHVPIRTAEADYGYDLGTSLAAPAISGVSALLLSSHPNFSMEEVPTVLLESSEKNFFIPNEASGHRATFVYEGAPPRHATPDIKYAPFDPAVYGQGVLSVRRAFIYADLYEQVKARTPSVSWEERIPETNALFQEKIKEIDAQSVTKIQSQLRGYLARKHLKGMRTVAEQDQPY